MKRIKKLDKRTSDYMNMIPNFSDAMQIDHAIYELAAYDASKGLIMIPESADQAIELQKAIAKRFNYFKRLIQNSEISFVELHRTVAERNGPYPNRKHNLTTEQSIEECLNAPQQVVEEPVKAATNVLQKLFEDILQMSLDRHSPLLKSLKNKQQEEQEEQEEQGEQLNPLLFTNKTDTPIDSTSLNNRVLPIVEKIEHEGNKSSKGKNGRNIKIKSNKNPKSKKNT